MANRTMASVDAKDKLLYSRPKVTTNLKLQLKYDPIPNFKPESPAKLLTNIQVRKVNKNRQSNYTRY